MGRGLAHLYRASNHSCTIIAELVDLDLGPPLVMSGYILDSEI
jgi:hypothetical protein